MFLQRLIEYARRLNLPPTLYAEAPVRYIIELDGAGRLLSPEPTDTADPGSPRTRSGEIHAVPGVQRTSGIKPLLLASNAEYTYGLPRARSKEKRVVQCHQAFLALVERCAQITQEPAVVAVHGFLAGEPLGELRLPEGFDRAARITFRVDGRYVVDLPHRFL